MIGMKTQRKHLRPPLHWAGWSSCPTVPPKINRRLEDASRDYPSALRCTWRPRLRRDCSKWSILSHCAALVVFYHVSSPNGSNTTSFPKSLWDQITPVDISDITLTLTCICPGPALDTYESVQRGSAQIISSCLVQDTLWRFCGLNWIDGCEVLSKCCEVRFGTAPGQEVLVRTFDLLCCRKLSLNMTIIGWWHWHYNQNHSQSITTIWLFNIAMENHHFF